MEVFALILRIIFSLFFMYAGYMHFAKPRFFNHFIPNFLPKLTVNYVVGVIELLLGLGLVFSKTLSYAAIGIFILMLLFLPIHIWDATKIKPAIGSKKLAFVRIPLQFILMFFAWVIYVYS